MKWLVTFVDDSGAYNSGEAVLVDADDADEAATEGLDALLDAFHDTSCQCEGPIADHVTVLPFEQAIHFDVVRTATRRRRATRG
jgi:hypothetical protein